VAGTDILDGYPDTGSASIERSWCFTPYRIGVSFAYAGDVPAVHFVKPPGP
jgi:hypothetical protein